MAKKSTPPKYVKVEVRPASNILKIILILLILSNIESQKGEPGPKVKKKRNRQKIQHKKENHAN